MRIQTNRRYSNWWLEWIEYIGWHITVPWKISCDHFLSCFIPVTAELKRPWTLLITFLFILPLSALASCLCFPLAVIGFLLIIPIRSKRTPYLYSYVEHEESKVRPPKSRYRIATANVCLLPDYMSRVNNLHQTYQRTTKIGEKLLQDQLAARLKTADVQSDSNGNCANGSCTNGTTMGPRPSLFKCNPHVAPDTADVDGTTEDFNSVILEKFPEIDVLLLQETWYKVLSGRLATLLHKEFPWIVYDASYDSYESNVHGHNSGLMIASRYEIEKADFNWFPDCCSFCRFNSKGLLQVKVRLGEEQGVQKVGYVATTHLQVYQGNRPVHIKQLSSTSTWLDDFRQKTLKANEQVAFDVVGGDFNFDNISPVDEDASNHDIFKKYVDVGRTRSGQDHAWAVGTEFRQLFLYDPLISSPHGLKTALEDPILLQNYILDAKWKSATMALIYDVPERDDDGNIIPSQVGGRRRIDYLLHRREDKTLVSAYNPVTSLAGMTDHIPLCLTVQTQ